MPTTKPGRTRQVRGVSLTPSGIKEIQWQLDIRCWTKQDWAALAGVTHRTIESYLTGRRVDRATVEKLHRAIAAHPPIPGLAEVLAVSEVAS